MAVERGEEVIIARRDKPVVRLVIEKPVNAKRKLGALAGTMSMEVIDHLTSNKTLDQEIENDFMESIANNCPS